MADQFVTILPSTKYQPSRSESVVLLLPRLNVMLIAVSSTATRLGFAIGVFTRRLACGTTGVTG
ncbi:hypothetical protein [Haloarchaeobius sp. TZWSO28]|uniref:hypothetical protein n=1 Tax=Haloarchaeobius sp. TZWSO28 TaxID=3446119 RepID=UPI003EBD2015